MNFSTDGKLMIAEQAYRRSSSNSNSQLDTAITEKSRILLGTTLGDNAIQVDPLYIAPLKLDKNGIVSGFANQG